MKVIVETLGENPSPLNSIIATVTSAQQIDKSGEPMWVHKGDRIGFCYNKVQSFKWYERIGASDKFIEVTLEAGTVQKLAKFIEDQAAIKSNDFIDS